VFSRFGAFDTHFSKAIQQIHAPRPGASRLPESGEVDIVRRFGISCLRPLRELSRRRAVTGHHGPTHLICHIDIVTVAQTVEGIAAA